MKFLICAPPYNEKSGGIVVLHDLRKEMVDLGYDAHLAIFTPVTTTQTRYDSTTDIQDVVENGVVIYPEVITGNPLGAKRVVRYFLNKEGAASGNKVEAGENDFILAFSKIYHPNPHAILPKEVSNPLFNTDGSEYVLDRTIDCTYIGKGSLYAECPVIEGTTEITRTWPETKQELADLLKKTRFLFMYDTMTAMITDSLRCGAIPVILMFKPYPENEIDNNYFGKIPRAIVQNGNVFIPPDFDQIRANYLGKIDYVAAQHSEILGGVVEQIKHHFKTI